MLCCYNAVIETKTRKQKGRQFNFERKPQCIKRCHTQQGVSNKHGEESSEVCPFHPGKVRAEGRSHAGACLEASPHILWGTFLCHFYLRNSSPGFLKVKNWDVRNPRAVVRSTASKPSPGAFGVKGHLHLKQVLRSSQCHLLSSTAGLAKRLWGWNRGGRRWMNPGWPWAEVGRDTSTDHGLLR